MTDALDCALREPASKDTAHLWLNCLASLSERVGENIFSAWFGRLEFERIDKATAVLSVPTQFLKSWLKGHYEADILESMRPFFPAIETLRIELRSAKPALSPQKILPQVQMLKPAVSVAPLPSYDPPSPDLPATAHVGLEAVIARLQLIPDKDLTFDSFVEAPSNRLAHEYAIRLARGSSTPNPIVLQSDVGRGKTHLARAIAAANPQALYLSAEKFRWAFTEVVSNSVQETMLCNGLDEVPLLIVDDLSFISTSPRLVDKLQRIVSSRIASGRPTMLVASCNVHDLVALSERFQSLLAGGLDLPIGAPEEDLRIAILKGFVAQANQPGFSLPPTVVSTIARVIQGNARDLKGAVNRLAANHSLGSSIGTPEDALKMIADLVRTAKPKTVRIEDIQRLVATHFNINRVDLLSSRRTANVVRPRQIAMYLAKITTLKSLPEIGRRFGGRDHTTVLHAVNKIGALAERDQSLAADLSALQTALSAV